MANEKINEYLDQTNVPHDDAFFGFDNWTGSAFLSTKILWSDLKSALGAVGNLGNSDLIKTDLIRYYTFSATESSPTDVLIFRNGATNNILTLNGSCEVYSNGLLNVSTNLFYGSGVGSLVSQGQNSIFGNNSFSGLITGLSNIGLGFDAGRYLANGSTELIDSNCSIFIGSESKALAANSDNEIVIGCGTTGNGNNTTTIGNGNTTDSYLFGDLTISGLAGAGGNVSVDTNGKLLLGVASDPFIHVTSYASLPVTGSTASAYITDDTDFMYIWDTDDSVYVKVGNEDIYNRDGILSDDERVFKLKLDTNVSFLDFQNLSGNSILKIDGSRNLYLDGLKAPTGESYFLKINDSGLVTSENVLALNAQDLEAVLLQGNTTGAYDISVDFGQVIKSTNNNTFLDLDNAGTGEIYLTKNDDGYLSITDFGTIISKGQFFVSQSISTISLTDIRTTFSLTKGDFSKIGQITTTNNDLSFYLSTPQINYPTLISTQNSRVNQNLTNSVVLGGFDIVAKTDNSAYVNQIGFNTGEAFETILGYTTPTSDNTVTIQDGSGTLAFLSDVSSMYSADGVISSNRIVSTTDKNLTFSTDGNAIALNIDGTLGTLGVGTTGVSSTSIDIKFDPGMSPLGFYQNRVGGASIGDSVNSGWAFNDNLGNRTGGTSSILCRVTGVGAGTVSTSLTLSNTINVTNGGVLVHPSAATQGVNAMFQVKQTAASPFDACMSLVSRGNTASQTIFQANNLAINTALKITGDLNSVFNGSQIATGDLSHQGLTDTNLFYSDAGLDRVGIGTATANISSKLTVTGDVETLGNADGLIVLDRSNATRYRIYSDGGVLSIEAA